jgi:hypothetical protein
MGFSLFMKEVNSCDEIKGSNPSPARLFQGHWLIL